MGKGRGEKKERSDRSERHIDASINTIVFSVNYARRLGFIVGVTHTSLLDGQHKDRINKKKSISELTFFSFHPVVL